VWSDNRNEIAPSIYPFTLSASHRKMFACLLVCLFAFCFFALANIGKPAFTTAFSPLAKTKDIPRSLPLLLWRGAGNDMPIIKGLSVLTRNLSAPEII